MLKIKWFIARLVVKINPKLYVYMSYFRHRQSLPNLKNPKNISEIVLSNIISGKINEFSDYVDKLKVRDYFISKKLEEHLPKIFGVWKKIDDIDFDKLPKAFVLKTNNGCGSHYICRDISEMNVEDARVVINEALNSKIGFLETQYNFIEPLIFCEEFIDDKTGGLPKDYKFMCVEGEIKSILVVSERTIKGIKLSTFDKEWGELNYITPKYRAVLDVEKPKNLELMSEIAKKVAKDFDFVRVDFYDVGNRIFIGELTFSPHGGIMSYFTNDAIKLMGR